MVWDIYFAIFFFVFLGLREIISGFRGYALRIRTGESERDTFPETKLNVEIREKPVVV